jgi:ferredoxin
MGDDGVATAVAETDDRGAALEAAQGCPMGAITVLDDDGKVLR